MRNFLYMLAVILLVMMPTSVSLAWYYFTRNPNLRPLGITQEAILAYENLIGRSAQVIVRVEWSDASGSEAVLERFAAQIERAFEAKGVEARVISQMGAEQTLISYSIGRSFLGPYRGAHASDGIRASVEALRMLQKPVRGG